MKIFFISKKVRVFLLILLAGAGLIVIKSNEPKISKEDKIYLLAFIRDWNLETVPLTVHENFEAEIRFISRVQDSILSNIQHVEIPDTHFGNVRYYYTHRQGFCYDRSILLEKILSYYNFDFRHVFIYKNTGSSSIMNPGLFKRQLASHALTEVRTSKGWMLVETNSNWIGLTCNGKVLSIKELKKELQSNSCPEFRKLPTHGQPFWHQFAAAGFSYVYGLYSRHGRFFSPHLRLPDYSFRMLRFNLFT